ESDLSFASLSQSMKGGSAAVKDVQAGLSLVTRLLFSVALLVISVPAAMVTPLLRRRIGLCTLAMHAPFGLFLVGNASHVFARHPAGWLFSAWFLLLLVISLVGVARGIQRMFKPDGGAHVHRFSLGEPVPLLHRVWSATLGERARSGV